MLGSDVPIENLRSGFAPLYAAYDEIFSGFSGDERAMLFHRTAERWYALAVPPRSAQRPLQGTVPNCVIPYDQAIRRKGEIVRSPCRSHSRSSDQSPLQAAAADNCHGYRNPASSSSQPASLCMTLIGRTHLPQTSLSS